MIVKAHEVPLNLLSLISIYLRLQEHHPKKNNIYNEILAYYSGYKGELSFDYYLKFIDQSHFFTLHSLRLPFTMSFYQMDTLVLTPNFFLIIEVKNHTGYIRFNHEKGRMYQQLDFDEKSYQDPILQADTQTHQLKSFLFSKNLQHVPIESLVVFVNQNVTLNEERNNRIIYGFQLMQKFDELLKKYPQSIINQNQLDHLQASLVKQHKPLHSDMLKQTNISPKELAFGVICPNCFNLPMQRTGTWKCLHCKQNYRKAHQQSLIEYALIFGNSITNKKARKLLQIDSIHSTQKLLYRAGLPYQGKNSSREYFLKFNLQEDGLFLLDHYLKLRKRDDLINSQNILI